MITTKDLDSLVAEILSDPHIVEFKRDDAWEIPEVNPALWSKPYEEHLKALGGYLKLPYIIDNFNNHIERRKWIKSILEKYGVDAEFFLDTNCLRFGEISMVGRIICDIRGSYIGTDKGTYTLLSSWFTEELILPHYDTMLIEEKVRIVQETKQKVYEFLQFLSHQVPAKGSIPENV